jgi:hypothetical protein
MANLWPREMPSWIDEDERRSAEVRVFKKLNEMLDETWSVYYSRPWWGINRTGGEIDGEADFIVAHPVKGILFIEVKGGRISYDPQSSNWYSTDRHEIKHRIKNPVEQAKTCRYRFLDKLKSQTGWPKHRIRMRYGVIFTDTVSPLESRFLGGYEPLLFCHSERFESDLSSWVIDRLRENDSDEESGPSVSGLDVLHNLIAAPVNLRVTLQRESESAITQMNSLLTGAQLQILMELENEPTAVVVGGAGTGKTVVAMELATRLSASSKFVYFISVGSGLLSDVKLKLSVYPSIRIMGKAEFIASQEINPLGPDDVLIIDEGQDFDNMFWNYVETLKLSYDFGLYVFLDSNQSVYRSPEDLSTRLQAKQMILRINLRNTRSIAELTSNLYSGPAMQTYGPVGSPPEVILEANTNDAIAKVSELVQRLINVEGVRLSSITILAHSSSLLNRIKPALLASRILFKTAGKHGVESITLDTAYNFKGMESPFVIIFCDKELANSEELSYVSTSRARSHLYIVGDFRGTVLESALT